MRNNKDSDHLLTPDERAFYIRTSLEDTQRIIQECMTRYRKDGNLSAIKLALDGYVQVAETLKKIKEQYSYGHDYDYGAIER
jgi:hypothetical protein